MFTFAEEPQRVVTGLLKDEQFSHIRRHVIGCLFSEKVLTDRGAAARAIISVPAQITSKAHERQLLEWTYRQLFTPLGDDLPDFVIFFDVSLWAYETPLLREQLCYHELCHVQQRKDKWGAPTFEKNGRPALHLVPHDVERFYSELERYADVIPGTINTQQAIAKGMRNTRKLRLA